MSSREGPAELRDALAQYVHAVHEHWLTTVRQAGANVADLPLGGDPFTVAVVAGRDLHVLATRDALPAPVAHEQPVHAEVDGLTWQVRFLDPSVVPALADSADEGGPDVTEVLGVTHALYHLTVGPTGSLSGHQAMHAGIGLAQAHLKAAGSSP